MNQQSNVVSEIRDIGLTNTFILFGKSMDNVVKCDVAVLPMLSQECGKYAKSAFLKLFSSGDHFH